MPVNAGDELKKIRRKPGGQHILKSTFGRRPYLWRSLAVLILAGIMFVKNLLADQKPGGQKTAAAPAPLLNPSKQGEGLVAYWSFDEGKGAVAKDCSGKGNDGKINGPQWIKLSKGYALEFDGKDDCVDCGNGENLNLGKGDFTISFWKFQTRENPPCPVLSDGEHDDYQNSWYIEFYPGTINVSFRYGGICQGTENWKTIGFTGCYKWEQITIVRDVVKLEVRIYIDGDLKHTWGPIKVVDVRDNKSFLIGWDRRYGSFKGTLDEIRIYNVALNEKAIKELYRGDINAEE